jgi:ankyrin repeat protein
MARAGRPTKSDPRFDRVPFLIEKQENEEVKKILSETGIDAGDSYIRSALVWAAFYNNTNLLVWLLDNQADVNHQDRNGYSALHFAAQEKNEVVVKILLEAGAQIDIMDIYGNTPLWTAIFSAKGNNKLVKLCIQAGANLDSLNNYQRTTRQLAETIAGLDLETLR